MRANTGAINNYNRTACAPEQTKTYGHDSIRDLCQSTSVLCCGQSSNRGHKRDEATEKFKVVVRFGLVWYLAWLENEKSSQWQNHRLDSSYSKGPWGGGLHPDITGYVGF